MNKSRIILTINDKFYINEIISDNFSSFRKNDNFLLCLPGKTDRNTLNILIKKIQLERKSYFRVPFQISCYSDKIQSCLIDFSLNKENFIKLEILIQDEINTVNMRMRDLEQFAAGTAHKINNLITPLSGSYQIMKLSLQENESSGTIDLVDIEKYLTMVQSSLIKLTSLTRDLTQFAYELQPPQNTPLFIDSLFEEIIQTHSELLQSSHIKLNLEINIEHKEYLIPGTTLKAILMRIIENSKEHMPDGGIIKIDINEDDLFFRICICDTGKGITEEIRKRVFDPYTSTKKSGKGTGIGLTAVYQLVSVCGGSADVENRNPRGLKITLNWPKIAVPEPC